jgi:hypothetical protein
MSSSIWEAFVETTDIDCIEMKDKIQDLIQKETLDITSEALLNYFFEASRRFRLEIRSRYPAHQAIPTVVREPDEPASKT